MASIVWFRNDLRVESNPALLAAIERASPIVPVYIAAQSEGSASDIFLHYALIHLKAKLQKLGLDLIIRQGEPLKELKEIIKTNKADAVFWNRRYEPENIKRDTEILHQLSDQAIKVQSFNSSLVLEPWQIENKQGQPFKVFTAYHKRHLELAPLTNANSQPQISSKVSKESRELISKTTSLDLRALALMPKQKWGQGIIEYWGLNDETGLADYHKSLRDFIEQQADPSKCYPELRNRPDLDGVSKLSPYLHFGVLSPEIIRAEIETVYPNHKPIAVYEYLRQIAWRDFAHHLIYHFPKMVNEEQNPKFRKFPYKKSQQAKKYFEAWCKGQTGYPIVDAGMRELWHTGWMHNRVRMIVASFLVKDLLIDWREGAKWFMDTLVDADLANNTMGWQWCAGTGVDASPYFRIFNPITQGEKFDPNGDYIRKWIPELSTVSNTHIHKVWESGMDLDYPDPIVNHSHARELALNLYKTL